jgi:hypothetical protein
MNKKRNSDHQRSQFSCGPGVHYHSMDRDLIPECDRAKAAQPCDLFACLSEDHQVAVLGPKVCFLVFGRNHSSQYLTTKTFRDRNLMLEI